jgi:phospholipid/cholesterol/gamma-HCH transport system ATP-binding protein
MTESKTTCFFELRQLCKSFNGNPILKNIDLKLEKGKTTVLIGPSGCGKTVLLKHLVVLLRPDRGQVLFEGQRIDTLPENELLPLRRRCSYLFQGGALFDSQTIGENVAFPLLENTRMSRTEISCLVTEKLGMVGLHDIENRLPSELSGGQQRRVALARAIALEPEAVLYDEPTTGLDPIRSETINQLILKLQRDLQMTSIVVTHDMNSACRIADRILMMKDGHILADGTPDDIRESSNPDVQQFIRGYSDEHYEQKNSKDSKNE